jgi:hypothetical protein
MDNDLENSRQEQEEKIQLEKKRLEKKFKEIESNLKKDTISKKQLYEWFKEEIERKDKEVERLKKENHILFLTAMRSREVLLKNNEPMPDISKLKINKKD